MKDLKTDPPCPTSEQCEKHEVIEHEGQKFTACSYPAMGGYGARCLVNVYQPEGRFEAFVWHDGEFPFSAVDSHSGIPNSPAHVHHCSAAEFVDFGNFVLSLRDPEWGP